MKTKGSKQALRSQSNRIALEPRIVFDAALPIAGAEIIDNFVDRPISEPIYTEAAISPFSDTHDTNKSISINSNTDNTDRSLIDGTLAPSNLTAHEIIFIDAIVSDLQQYIGQHPNADVVLLDSSKDALGQIAAVLNGRTGIDAVHILSHGDSGQLSIGNGVLNAQNLLSGSHAADLAIIKAALSDDADILIYGCNLAAGDKGQAFVNALAQATGADIAASTDTTGAASKGGDWDLEHQTGFVSAVTLNAPKWSEVLGRGSGTGTGNGNQAPVAAPDKTEVSDTSPTNGNLLSNDTDINNDTLTVTKFTISGVDYTPGTKVNLPNVGSIVINTNGTYAFKPILGFAATIPTISYTITDGAATSDSTLTLTPKPDSGGGLFEQLISQPTSPFIGTTGQNPPASLTQPPENLFVLNVIRESQNSLPENAALGVLNADTPTRNELNNATNDLKGLPIGMDSNLFVQQAVRSLPLITGPSLFVQNAVRQSQLESNLRGLGVTSFNSATTSVSDLLSTFDLGAPNAVGAVTSADAAGQVADKQIIAPTNADAPTAEIKLDQKVAPQDTLLPNEQVVNEVSKQSRKRTLAVQKGAFGFSKQIKAVEKGLQQNNLFKL